MLALIRANNVNLPLFLHVFGATILVGAIAATAIAAGKSGTSLMLRRVAFRTVLLLVIPAWILMRVAGQWTDSRSIPDDPGWLGVGFIVSDAGVLVLLLAVIFGWLSVRKPDRGWPARTVTALALLYLAALLVAMFAMSAKPGA